MKNLIQNQITQSCTCFYYRLDPSIRNAEESDGFGVRVYFIFLGRSDFAF